MDKPEREVTRVLTVGPPGSGKSTLLRTFVYGESPDKPSSYPVGTVYPQKAGILVQDTVGDIHKDMRFKPDTVLLCIPLNGHIDNKLLGNWMQDLKGSLPKEAKVVFVGMKSDEALDGSRQILKDFANEEDSPYVECSGLKGNGIQQVFNKAVNPVLDVGLNEGIEAIAPAVGKEKKLGGRFNLTLKSLSEAPPPAAVKSKAIVGPGGVFGRFMETKKAADAAKKEAKSMETVSISITDMQFSPEILQKLKEVTKVDVTAQNVHAIHVIQGLTYKKPFNNYSTDNTIPPDNKKETTIKFVSEDNGKGISIEATCPHKNEEAVTRQVVREVEKITKGLSSAKVEVNDATTMKSLRGALEDSAKKSANFTVESPRVVILK